MMYSPKRDGYKTAKTKLPLHLVRGFQCTYELNLNLINQETLGSNSTDMVQAEKSLHNTLSN